MVLDLHGHVAVLSACLLGGVFVCGQGSGTMPSKYI